MASDPQDVFHGATLTFGTSGWTGYITNMNFSGMSRGALNTSHQGTTDGMMTFGPADLADPGGLAVDFFFNPDTGLLIDNAAETVTLTWPSTATWAFTGFATGFTVTGTHNQYLTGTMNLKASGLIAITPAA
jgi:hypothetical protein